MASRKSKVRFSSLHVGEEGWARLQGTGSFAPFRKDSRGGGVFTGDPKRGPSGLKGRRFAAFRDPIVIRKSKRKVK